jgi:hypothetical protein
MTYRRGGRADNGQNELKGIAASDQLVARMLLLVTRWRRVAGARAATGDRF